MHLVAWEDVCKPKKSGSLGISRIRDINKALIFKWLWRFGTDKESFWRHIVADKYGTVNKWETKTTTMLYGCSC